MRRLTTCYSGVCAGTLTVHTPSSMYVIIGPGMWHHSRGRDEGSQAEAPQFNSQIGWWMLGFGASLYEVLHSLRCTSGNVCCALDDGLSSSEMEDKVSVLARISSVCISTRLPLRLGATNLGGSSSTLRHAYSVN